MAGPYFKPGEYERLPKKQKFIYWICVCLGLGVIVFLLLKPMIM
jgi:hypothetical protein